MGSITSTIIELLANQLLLKYCGDKNDQNDELIIVLRPGLSIAIINRFFLLKTCIWRFQMMIFIDN